MTWGQEVCYASLHSEPASALSLLTVWLLWENPGMARCWEMSTLPAEYIPWNDIDKQLWVTGFHCVWSVLEYQDGNYLYPGQCKQTIWRSQIGWYRPWGRNILMARHSTFLKSRSLWSHDYRKFIYLFCCSVSIFQNEILISKIYQNCNKKIKSGQTISITLPTF